MNGIPTAVNPVNPRFLLIVRCAIALIWLYEGLWQKLIARNAHELAIVRQFTDTDNAALQLMSAIGTAETLLAVAILSGLFARPLAWFQIAILVVMNLGKNNFRPAPGFTQPPRLPDAAIHHPSYFRAPTRRGHRNQSGPYKAKAACF